MAFGSSDDILFLNLQGHYKDFCFVTDLPAVYFSSHSIFCMWIVFQNFSYIKINVKILHFK